MELAICDCYESCRVSFKNLIAALQNPARDFNGQVTIATVDDERGRFEVWAGNVGARHYPKSRVSLDYRLRESLFYRERIIRLLKDLDETLQSATSLVLGKRKPIEECATPLGSTTESDTDDGESEPESDSAEEDDESRSKESNLSEIDALRALLARQDSSDALPKSSTSDIMTIRRKPQATEMSQLCQGLQDLMVHLYKMSMMIRRPIPHDRFAKFGSINVSHFDAFEVGHIQNCFPSVSEVLTLRLARAMKRRRQYLIYNERHHQALAWPRRIQAQKDVSIEKPPKSQDQEVDNLSKPASTLYSHSEIIHPAGESFSCFGTNTEATQFVPPEDSDDNRASSDAGTLSTYASTAGSDDKVHIPTRPRGPDGNELEQFECPHCFHLVEIKSSRDWKLHIFRDLRPYVCTFEQCTLPDLVFEKRSEWFSHEMQFHRKDWSCNVVGHTTYQTEGEFEDHLRREHSTWFVESQLPSLMTMFGRPSRAPLSLCPFCADHHQEFHDGDSSQPCLTDGGEPIIRKDRVMVPTGKIKRHISRHLERLALFAIPTPNYADGDGRSLRSDYVDKASSESTSSFSETDYSSSLPKLSIVQDTDGLDTGDFDQTMEDEILPEELLPAPAETKVKLPCRIVKPYRKNLDFVGRKEVLDQIGQALAPGHSPRTFRQLFALCGSGGVGKTQTALSYVFDHMDDFQVVLWAHASNQMQLLECFTGFAIDLGLVSGEDDAVKDPYAYKGILKRWLDTAEIPWLLILDSADGEDGSDVLKEYLPNGAYGSILITSRDSSLVPKYGGAILGELGEKDATVLLLKSTESINNVPSSTWEHRSTSDTVAAGKIVQMLGYLPIGIMQAAQLINKDHLRLEQFIDAYNERDLIENAQSVQLEIPSHEGYPFNLSTVWTMSYKTLKPDQQDLLNLMAFFDPVGIPLQLLSEGSQKASSLGNVPLVFIDDDRKLSRCKSGLVRSSLVMQNEYLEQLWMHRLVQQSCHIRMDPTTRQEAFSRALALLAAMWPMTDPDNRHHVALWPLQNLLFPHLLSLARFYDESQLSEVPLYTDQYFLTLLFDASFFCYERGVYQPVRPLTDVAERFSAKSQEDCSLRMADIYFARGAVECETNLRQECFQSWTKQYDCVQASIASGHIESPDAREALAYGSLGNGCMALDRFEEAEAWYMKAFNVWDRLTRPSEDRKIYTSNMGACYYLQGKLDEAEEILSPDITDWNDTSSFKTANTMFALGNVQILQGKINEAFQTHLQAYKLFKATVGDRHHRTADACYKLGWHFHRQRKYGNAIAILQQALETYSNELKYQNESARTMYKLGCVKVDEGDIESGTALIKEAKSVYRRIVLGESPFELGQDKFDQLVMSWSR